MCVCVCVCVWGGGGGGGSYLKEGGCFFEIASTVDIIFKLLSRKLSIVLSG